jgi:uncharacterized protein (UPF0276 family)
MLEEDFRLATAPLFIDESVDVLEWSFDTGWGRTMPAWADELLDFYAENGRLLGHGVHFSPLSATWEPRQERWLANLAVEVGRRRYRHISEHYGFMTAPPFTRGAPLPLPRSEATLAVAHDRLERLRSIAACPLGLENLALTWSREEALAHGDWLHTLLAHDDDFIVLDVHNLHCQRVNFDIGADAALDSFPLDRVREIHISGGSDLPAWPDGPLHVRCDTHDDRIPEPVFELLARALERCASVEAVIFERLGGTIRDARAAEGLREDFRRVRTIAAAATKRDASRPRPRSTPLIADDIASLAAFQSSLLECLVECPTEADLRASLARSPAAMVYRELVTSADGRSLGIASRVMKKYARKIAAW